jgi:DNA-binding NtrC family response regulator
METLNTILRRLHGRPDRTEELRRRLEELERPYELTKDELCSHLREVVQWLHERGEIDTAEELLQTVANLFPADAASPTRFAATVLRLMGVTHRLSGKLHEAGDCLARAKVYCELIGDAGGLAMSLNALGAVYASLHYWAIAERCFLDARALAKAQGLVSLEHKAQRNLLFAYVHQGRFPEVRTLLREARPVARRVGEPADAYAVSGTLALGGFLRQHGFARSASNVLERALETAAGRFRHAEGIAHDLLGRCALDLGQVQVALRHFKAELAIGFEISPLGDLTNLAYLGLAETHLALGDFVACERATSEGLARAERASADELRVGFLRVKAHAARSRGDLEAARRHFREALAIAVQRGFRVEEAITLEDYGFSLVQEGEQAAGARKLGDAMHLYRSMGLGRLARRLGRGARARTRSYRWQGRPARRTVREANGWEAYGIVTRSRALLGELEKLRGLAATPLPVLILGETGSGKEPLARALHALSGRSGKFVDVAPAIPESMLESDLFGCEKGAFTGAETRAGLVANAENGTLFLDEVGDLPLTLQVKLLRFLETLTYRRVGGTTALSVKLRVISATNALLDAKVAKGQFREDLYHRLAAGVLRVPALRDRPEDIEPLTRFFLADVAAQSGRALELDEAVLPLFGAYKWPGNVRELRNTIATMAWTASARGQSRVGTDLVPRQLVQATDVRPAPSAEMIRHALASANANFAQAARVLGISRQQLYRRISELGLGPSELRSDLG